MIRLLIQQRITRKHATKNRQNHEVDVN